MRREKLAVALAIMALAGCGAETERTKAGGGKPQQTKAKTLTFATFDAALLDNVGLPAFKKAVAERSDGRLEVKVSLVDLEKATSADRPDLAIARLVGKGEYDLGYGWARSFTDGAPAFDALTAPLMVDSPSLYAPLQSSGLPKFVLDRLPEGLDGVGLLWGEPALLWSQGRPALSRSDLQASPGFGSYPELSASQGKVMAALGIAKIKRLDWATGLIEALKSPRPYLFSISQSGLLYNALGAWGVVGTANLPMTTDLPVILGSSRRLARLSEQERGWLHAAGQDAAKVSLAQTKDDAEQYARICKDSGVRLALAEPQELQAMRERAMAVYRANANSDFQRVLDLVEEVRGDGAPPSPEIREECSGPLPELAQPVRVNRDPGALNGVYRFEVTAQEYLDAGYPDPVSAKDNEGVITMTLRNGKAIHEVRERGKHSTGQDIARAEYEYRVESDRVTFYPGLGPVTTRWRRDRDGSLRFRSDLKLDPVGAVNWGSKTWKRVR